MTRRLVLGLLGFATLVLVLLVVPLGVANQRSERDDLTRRLERDAVAAASLVTDVLATDTPIGADLEARLAEYATDSGARVVVVDADGTSVVDTGEDGRQVELGRDFSSRPEVAAALDGRIDSGERGSDTLGHQLLFVAVPVTSGGTSLGAVRLSYPAEELDERITSYWLGLAAIALAVLAVAALAALLVARWIARPLDGIAKVADDVGAGDLSARADVRDGPPEVRAVAARLNASVAALQQTIEDQRAFTADASHQLRTPLHALTLRLDNVAHELASGDVADAAADVDKASAEVARLASLVEALLVLERADRRGATTAPDPVDLVEIIRGRLEDWTERASREDVAIELDLPDTLVALADPVHVEQVLDNLVDNAIGVSPAGRDVQVIGRAVGDACELHVVDEGPGMDDEQLAQAFRRFHSGADRPRRGSGGFGLGLAIVRRLAEVDGGSAELRHGPGRGVDAVVRYRAARPSDG